MNYLFGLDDGSGIPSFEMIWLAFVMLEKWDKVWVNEDKKWLLTEETDFKKI